MADSLELIDQDYVLVRGPPVDMSSSASISKLCTVLSKSGSPPQVSGSISPAPTAPMPIIGTAASRVGHTESFESHGSAPGTSPGSTDVTDTLEQPSTDCSTRIRSLERCASAITELVNEKVFYRTLFFFFFFFNFSNLLSIEKCRKEFDSLKSYTVPRKLRFIGSNDLVIVMCFVYYFEFVHAFLSRLFNVENDFPHLVIVLPSSGLKLCLKLKKFHGKQKKINCVNEL